MMRCHRTNCQLLLKLLSRRYRCHSIPFAQGQRCLSSLPLQDAVVHRVHGGDYASQEYLLLSSSSERTSTSCDVDNDNNPDAVPRSQAWASLRSHRNIIFAAKLGPLTKPDNISDSDWRLTKVCAPLVEAAMDVCSSTGDQIQAVSPLHGLSQWVVQHWDRPQEVLPTAEVSAWEELDAVSKAAAYAIATGIPRSGHTVVGQGTFRDGAAAWKLWARAYVPWVEEAQLYQNHGAELMDIEHLADTNPAYLKSAGGAMARFLFL